VRLPAASSSVQLPGLQIHIPLSLQSADDTADVLYLKTVEGEQHFQAEVQPSTFQPAQLGPSQPTKDSPTPLLAREL
jgi:hypothetical protein